jgi:hypothetical protein
MLQIVVAFNIVIYDSNNNIYDRNTRESAVNRALDGSTYPG